MNILFSLTNLSIGGAQMFVLNLAKAFAADSNCNVFIYDHNPEYSSPSLYEFCDSQVRILNYSGNPLIRFCVLRFNGLIKRMGIRFDFRKWYNRKKFIRALKRNKIDVVNSQMSESDFLCGEMVDRSIKLVITLHGEFELYLNSSDKKISSKIDALLDRDPEIIYTADKNYTAIADKLKIREITAKKIYIGIQPNVFKVKPVNKKSLFGTDDVFVLGMVSRGIPEKGWEFLINLFNTLLKDNSRLRLLLIADGSYIRTVVDAEKNDKIVLLQMEKEYQDYFSYYQAMDLFVFPTFFKGESVPTVIAESLYWRIPVIANDHAEIKNMISSELGLAGALVKVEDLVQMTSNYMVKIKEYSCNAGLMQSKKLLCDAAYVKFDISSIKDQYNTIFKN